MIRHLLSIITAASALALAEPLAAAPSIDPHLSSAINSAPLALTPAIITYHESPDAAEIAALSTLGIVGGVVLNELPMVQTAINKAQFDALRSEPGIASIYGNRLYGLLTNESRPFIGVDALQSDRQLTTANGGFPVTGEGIGVAYVDTGIDATHPDLELGNTTVQNVFFPLAEIQTGITGVEAGLPAGFVPPVFVEDQPFTDVEGGHGTFGAGTTAGSGAASGNFYGGVAPGANLIGLVAGNDLGLSTFSITQAYDYALVNQFRYNIRVANNSFGGDLGDPSNYDPDEPINAATRELHDRFITVVYAAGNSGDVPGAINFLAVAPWVISVAAGEKQGLGTPAGFSSRGEDNGTGTDVAGQPADPNAPPNFRPDIIGPGVDIKSARSKGPGLTNLAGTALGQDLNIPPAFLPFYTTSQGTSFSTPHVSGVVALMLEVNPDLTPDDVVTILRETATPMPFEERVVGAGYVDAHNAVRSAAGFPLVDHPANLFPDPGGPEIVDAENDQIGTTAQDLRTGDFIYDAAANQIVYQLDLTDSSTVTPNMRWTQSSVFDGIRVFVSSNITETTAPEFEYGTIAPDPDTGINTQTNLGPADSGVVEGNRITVRLGIGKVNAAVGFDVVGTTSTATQAQAQILIGTSLTGGLLLNSDNANGSDFVVDGNGGDGGGPAPAGECGTEGIREGFSGAVLRSGQPVEFELDFRCSSLDAKLVWHPGNQDLAFELLDDNGNLVAAPDDPSGRRIHVENLAAGDYVYRVSGSVGKNTDFTISSRQER
ncbi:MAG: S8 family serine peptidase [Gammaproteobacteria bacterium]